VTSGIVGDGVTKNVGFTAEFDPVGEDYSVIVEDDGAVCYAYLWHKEKIVADVWLYNRTNTPIDAPWKLPNARELLPFKNAKKFVSDDYFKPPESNNEIRAQARLSGQHLLCVDIFFHEKHVATLVPGCKPSFALMAKCNGPLAKLLSERYSALPRPDGFE